MFTIFALAIGVAAAGSVLLLHVDVWVAIGVWLLALVSYVTGGMVGFNKGWDARTAVRPQKSGWFR
jgi:hypothetical protein